MLEIFKNNAFSLQSLTDVVNELKYRPGRISSMGLFTPTSVATTSISIERIGDMLQLVKPTPRGGPGEVRDMPKRTLRSFAIPHFQRDWAVMADEVQNVRALGSESQLKTVQSVVTEKQGANLDDFALTEEHARLGAITGIVTYADGSTLNMFTEFGVAQDAEINFNLATAEGGALREACVNVIRKMRAHLGGLGFARVHAFVGDQFFDALMKNPELRATYEGWSDAKILRESYVGPNRSENPMIEFGGIVFENYGEIGGNGVGIATDKAHFFPVGVSRLFRTYYAPADYVETVNTLGRRLYSKQWPMSNDKGINGEMQSNALQLCTRPKVLLRGRAG